MNRNRFKEIQGGCLMAKKYDLIVIGTGPAGKSIAEKTSEAGLSVATIESNGYGGTCPNRGCTPKKILSSVSAKIAETNRLVGRGVQTETMMNWEDLIALKREFIDPVPEETEKELKELGVSTYHGYASFISKNEIKINNDILYGAKVVVATGDTPLELPINGAEHLVMSEGFLELDEMPKHVVFVGGGYISFEFAHIAARAGSKVTILEGADEALGAFDPDLTELLVKRSEEIGIDVHLETMVKAIEKDGESYIVKGEKNEEVVKWESDIVIHGAGRVPNIDKLDLDKADIEYDKQGIIVNDMQQSTTNPDVYAAGDVANTEGPPLTPVAGLHARLVINQLLERDAEPINYKGIPSIAFTTPKLGMVGMSEQEAKDSRKKINVKMSDMTNWFTYRHLNEPVAAVKLIIDKETDQILGAHVLADEADELINYFASAIQLNVTTRQLTGVIYAFPTNFSDITKMFN